MEYTVAAISPETRSFSTRFGDMISYKVRFNETGTTVVELAQKASSPAPQVGQTLSGTIDMNAQFGPKFKKEYAQQGGGFGNTPQASGAKASYAGTGTSKSQGDNYTMYLSYAKDIAVALIANGKGIDDMGDILEAVAAGGDFLYEAHNKPKQEEAPTPSKDVAPSDQDVIDLMGEDGSKPIDISEIPF